MIYTSLLSLSPRGEMDDSQILLSTRFLEPRNNTNQKLFSLDLLYSVEQCNFTPDNWNSRFIKRNFCFPWRFRKKSGFHCTMKL